MIALDVAARFAAKVRHDEDGCWEWIASRNREGYGWFSLNRKNRKAHRVSWMLANGPIPDGLLVLHSCDNPPCVRPDHLFLGTKIDNARDYHEKRRAAAWAA